MLDAEWFECHGRSVAGGVREVNRFDVKLCGRRKCFTYIMNVYILN